MPKAKRVGQLTLLGRTEARIPASLRKRAWRLFPNPAPRRNYRIHFETDDFTSVCPVTGQPDFARIDIDYVPDRLCVESKSLKFYLASYRNEHAFNEAVTNRILDDFVKAARRARQPSPRNFRARRNRAHGSRRVPGQEAEPRREMKKRRNTAALQSALRARKHSCQLVSIRG